MSRPQRAWSAWSIVAHCRLLFITPLLFYNQTDKLPVAMIQAMPRIRLLY